MTDSKTTVSELKQAIHRLVLEKGWGDENGVQNPQHVAMALTVEASELLEHFQWLEPAQVEALLNGGDPDRVRAIGEEFADVCMYGLQLMDCLGIDLSEQIENKIKKVSARPSGMRGRYADELLKRQKGESNEGDN
ncbi:MAG: nucleotide pyrophosphohydrolase [Clostridia bacterium]|nr:nucleotide pyrophosphohydrolase [Clostridia bacterium]MBR5010641.1 nucleotide pyrophosphohydrolase [Clostridia bacterium]